MKIEIITIGDEILIGQITDTNSSWMAAELTRLGFEIVAITSVADQKADIINALDVAFGRADTLLLTGGIGPTKDDITKNTLCEYFNTHLIYNNSVLENITAIFAHRNVELNELTKNQALVPESATVIQNKVGTAPLLWFNNGSKVLVSMPGVPFEMKHAMTNEIMPRLSSLSNSDSFESNTLLVSYITESALAQLLDEFEGSLPPNTTLAYLPSYGMIRLRLSIRNSTNGANLEKLTEQLKALVQPYLLDDTDRPLESLLASLLKEKSLTLSTAESCTGGNIAHLITRHPGASEYYLGSVVSYSNDAKHNILGVSQDTLHRHGAVSQEVVEEMAAGSIRQFRTNCAIAVSGIAGPDGGTPQKPVGTTWICTYYDGKILSEQYSFGHSRIGNIERATNIALRQMIQLLREEK